MIEVKDCWLCDSCRKKANNECNDTFCMKLFKLDILYTEALVPLSLRKRIKFYVDEDGTDLDIFKQLNVIENDIENFIHEGKNIFMYSENCGVGKSSFSIRLLQDYFNQIWYKADLSCKALFINVPRFLISLKQNLNEPNDYAQHILDNVLKADLIIWDEIGTKSATEFEHENLLNMIDSRIANGKSNIYTSNLNPDEIKEKLGDRLYSRIVNNSLVLHFQGKDKRGLKV